MKVNVIRKKQNLGAASIHFQDNVAYTEYDLKKGDILEDSYGRQFKIKTLHSWHDDDRFAFYELTYENI